MAATRDGGLVSQLSPAGRERAGLRWYNVLPAGRAATVLATEAGLTAADVTGDAAAAVRRLILGDRDAT
jgi:hypothetical protein